MDVVVVAVLGFFGLVTTSLVGPYIIARQARRQRSEEKADEWRRADDLAARAEASAVAIVESNEAAAARAAAAAVKQDKKLDVIHILTNSTLSAAKEGQLLALEGQLELLLREEPRDDTALAVVQGKVEALRVEVDERARHDAVAAKVAEAPPG